MRKKNNSLSKPWVIMPAAGIGTRMQAVTQPKQYYRIDKLSIIEYTLSPFLKYPFKKIIVAIHKKDAYWRTLPISSDPQIHTIEGGATRAESVWNGLNVLKVKANPNDWVLIHDAVRPCLTLEKLTQFIHKVQKEKIGGLMAIPVRDTLKHVINGEVNKTIERENIWQAQTPQMFRYAYLYNALKRSRLHNTHAPDEASAIEQLGYHPKIIQGDNSNIKVTYAEDIDLANRLLRRK